MTLMVLPATNKTSALIRHKFANEGKRCDASMCSGRQTHKKSTHSAHPTYDNTAGRTLAPNHHDKEKSRLSTFTKRQGAQENTGNPKISVLLPWGLAAIYEVLYEYIQRDEEEAMTIFSSSSLENNSVKDKERTYISKEG